MELMFIFKCFYFSSNQSSFIMNGTASLGEYGFKTYPLPDFSLIDSCPSPSSGAISLNWGDTMKPQYLTLAFVLGLAGCATVTRGMNEQVTFTSEPSGATVRLSTGLQCSATPCTFDISRKQEFIAVFSMPGYEDLSIDVKTELAGTGAAGFAGNIIVGGVVGMGADAVTGATQDHKPNPVHAVMKPMAHKDAPKAKKHGRAVTPVS